MSRIQFNLFEVIKRLEMQKREPVTYSYVADESGLSRFTVQKIAMNHTSRVDLETLQKLVDFFDKEGLSITVNDLIVISNGSH